VGNAHHFTYKLYEDLGGAYYELDRFEKALEYLDRAIEIENTVGGERSTKLLPLIVSKVHCLNQMDKGQEALIYGTKTAENFLESNVKHKDLAELLLVIGRIYLEKEDLQSAETWTTKGVQIVEATKVVSPQIRDECESIGSLYLGSFNQKEKGLYFYERALDYAIKLKIMGMVDDENGEEDSLHHRYDSVAAVHVELGQFDKALQHYQRSNELRKEEFGDDSIEYAEGLGNVGEVYLKHGKLDEALQNLETSYKAHAEAEDDSLAEYLKKIATLLIEGYSLKDDEESSKRLIELRKDAEKWDKLIQDKDQEEGEGEDWEDV
jgi:tetratricopeptide (TPR) repeat protein